MKTINLLILLLSISSSSFSQKKVHQVEWKEGESKQVILYLSGKEIKDGKTIKDTSLVSKNVLYVKEVTDSNYFIQIITENQLVKLGKYYYEDVSNEMGSSMNFELDIKIVKDSLVSTVLNEREYHKKLSKTRDEVLEILKNKSPDKLEQATIQLDELYSGLEQKSEASHIIDLILNSYKVEYSKADTLFTTDTIANPFNLQSFNGAKVKTYVVATKEPETFNIVVEQSYDFEAYKDLISVLSNQTSNIVGKIIKDEGNHEVVNELYAMLEQQMKSIEFNAAASTIITRKLNSNWPIKILKESELKMKTKRGKVGALIDIIIEIK